MLVLCLHAIIVTVIIVRVIMRRPPTGVAFAWLFLVAIFPFIGPLIYFFIGERRIGHRRKRGISIVRTDYHKLSEAGAWENLTAGGLGSVSNCGMRLPRNWIFATS